MKKSKIFELPAEWKKCKTVKLRSLINVRFVLVVWMRTKLHCLATILSVLDVWPIGGWLTQLAHIAGNNFNMFMTLLEWRDYSRISLKSSSRTMRRPFVAKIAGQTLVTINRWESVLIADVCIYMLVACILQRSIFVLGNAKSACKKIASNTTNYSNSKQV